jgi:hypothetical protein
VPEAGGEELTCLGIIADHARSMPQAAAKPGQRFRHLGLLLELAEQREALLIVRRDTNLCPVVAEVILMNP